MLCLHTVYVCFLTVMAEMTSHNTDAKPKIFVACPFTETAYGPMELMLWPLLLSRVKHDQGWASQGGGFPEKWVRVQR